MNISLDELDKFFYSFQEYRKIGRSFNLDCEKLALWFAELQSPLIDSRKGAFHCNPWEIVGLKRDEVKNAAVLAWLLNPRGSHGLGDIALKAVLKKLRENLSNVFPFEPDASCIVRTEANPDGDFSNRVDIEIDSKSFYLIIEVKINAPERDNQIEDYGKIAELQAGQRPWAILFLTPKGKPPKTAGHYNQGKILPISWRELAAAIQQNRPLNLDDRSYGNQAIMTRYLVKHFLTHIAKINN